LRRARRFTLEELAPYLLDIPTPPVPFDWRAVFANDHPVELEIGFGKGTFLVGASQDLPERNFVGIEIARKYQLFTAARMAKRGLKNVRLAKADARAFVRDYVSSESCEGIHIYCPDPWWKRRHSKRKIFTPEFVVQCCRVLRLGGRLFIATDVAEYFEAIVALVGQHTRLQPSPGSEAKGPVSGLEAQTNFERKYLNQGRAIYRQTFQR
jgi:tRNA (guanine-N7-)-methyltransferase